MSDCPICSLPKGEEELMYSFAPSMLWTKTVKRQSGLTMLEFGYGEDPNDKAIFVLNYCPKCGKKLEINNG